MKKSSRTFSKTWGENLVRQFGMFLFLIIFGLLGVGLVVGIYYLTIPVLAMGTRGLIITIVVGVIYFVLLALFYSALNKVYNTALFVYADSGNIPGEYDSKVVKSAFKVQSH